MKKGFTLIELLAVITILSIIVLIASVSLSNVLKDSKEDLSNSQITAIKEATRSWSADNMDILPSNNDCSFLLLKDLKEDGLLDEKVIDPKNKKNISNDLKIKIESKMNGTGNSNLTYEVNPNSIKNCTYIGSGVYVDVPEGLTPVIYDGKNWKVPKENEEWYNYDKQMWANAVVLGSGKTKKPGEIVTVEGDNPDALMMLVYIPRYEYKIEGQYGTHTDGTPGTAALPGEIEVKFINSVQTKADNDYILHPAFDFGGEKLSGIWVGKFELSNTTISESNGLNCNNINCDTSSEFKILPNISSLERNDVSNFWYAIKSIENNETFGLNQVDSHMIKNSEWGAVAYLSQSKYGKYGNDNYEGSDKEIYQNISYSHVTGRSGNSSLRPRNIWSGLCSYNVTDDNCGIGASTTGNIYGIYDMSGGAFEYVMGIYALNNEIYVGYDGLDNSGFTGMIYNSGTPFIKDNGVDLPDSKYYDLYTSVTNTSSDDAIQSCDGEICYGHALSETVGWYGDNHSMIYTDSPWLVRGGGANSSHNNLLGIFNYGSSSGCDLSYLTTRVVYVQKK